MAVEPTPAEQRLIDAAAAGEVADYSTGKPDQDDPKEGASWDAERTLRAEVIRRLCLGLEPDWQVDPRGVRIRGARIEGDLDLGSGTIAFPLELVGCHFAGGFNLRDATTNRLDFRGSCLPNGLNADGMVVKGDLFMRNGFTARGAVRLLGADIGGNLECDNWSFENPDGNALSADGMTVKGSVFLRNGFSARGEVRLLRANIGGNLDCGNGVFENSGGYALSADGMSLKGSVFLRNDFSARGAVRLPGANIGGTLECQNGAFENPDGHALDLSAAHVAGLLVWRDLTVVGTVSFAHARIGRLADHQDSSPDRGALYLDGFEYDEFAFDAPTRAADRVDWLRRQASFRPQPYEQAVRVLRRMGHDRDARDIAIAKQIAMRESGLLTRWGQRWNRFLEVTVSYGYKPWKALSYALVFWLLGAILFDLGFRFGLVTPTSASVFLHPEFIKSGGTWLPPEYPRFSAPVYSLDVFLPIVDLHQESRWLPNMRNGWGWALWIYMWVHIVAGWVLTSVFVAALTGLIKKD